jgi:hypothetical protein
VSTRHDVNEMGTHGVTPSASVSAPWNASMFKRVVGLFAVSPFLSEVKPWNGVDDRMASTGTSGLHALRDSEGSISALRRLIEGSAPRGVQRRTGLGQEWSPR